jgi:formylmethanofuran dehydrogenase subunit B
VTPTVVKNAACTYCGCVCDDIELQTDGRRIVRATHACTLGRAWFHNHPADSCRPAAFIDGRAADLQEALGAAADILTRADLPLIYGLGDSTSESQQAAILLTEELGGVIDSHTSLTHGPSKIGAQLVGKVTCTLGEVRNRADLVIYWGSNPVETHPRHLKKYAFTPKGRYVPRGRYGRTMVVVDVRETLSARAADVFLQIRQGTDFELVTVLRALLHDRPFDASLVEACGVSIADLTRLIERMKRARFGVNFYGTGLTQTRGRHMNVAAVLSLTASLNEFTKFVAMPMRDHGNEAGIDNVLSWVAGYPFGVDYTRGYPRSNPGEFTAVDLLARRDADAALIVAADPWTTMPQAAIDHLERIPHVVIDRARACRRASARVHFTAATPGIDSAGTAYRMDKVPLPIRAAVGAAYATDEDILLGIYEAVRGSQTRISPRPGTHESPL